MPRGLFLFFVSPLNASLTELGTKGEVLNSDLYDGTISGNAGISSLTLTTGRWLVIPTGYCVINNIPQVCTLSTVSTKIGFAGTAVVTITNASDTVVMKNPSGSQGTCYKCGLIGIKL